MPVQIPTGFAQITFNFLTPAPGGFHQSVCTFGSGDAGGTSLATLAETWATVVWTNHLSGDTADNVIVTAVTAINAAAYGEFILNDGGARTGATSPPQVSTLVRKQTAVRGRHNRGRCYWPGLLTDSEVADDGTIDDGRWINLSESWNAILTELVDDNEVQPVVLHQEGYDGDPTPITRFVVSRAIATQRRRLRRY